MVTLSVVVPVKDEEQALPILHTELTHELQSIKKPYEILYIDDGSTDESSDVLKNIRVKDNHVRVIRFRANFGKSAALAYGLAHAKGDTMITMDADLQDNPKDIPILLSKLQEGYDLVVGWRKHRKDPLTKRISSIIFNVGTRLLSRVPVHDYNCGLKVIRRDVAQRLHLHGELHRFIPVLAAKLKYKIVEIPVTHRTRRWGASKFGIERSWRSVIDLLTVLFLTHYEGKPAHFFGLYGLLMTIVGFVINGYVTYIRFTTGTIGHHLPLLVAGALLMMIGVQLISIGLIAELIISMPRRDNEYYT